MARAFKTIIAASCLGLLIGAAAETQAADYYPGPVDALKTLVKTAKSNDVKRFRAYVHPKQGMKFNGRKLTAKRLKKKHLKSIASLSDQQYDCPKRWDKKGQVECQIVEGPPWQDFTLKWIGSSFYLVDFSYNEGSHNE